MNAIISGTLRVEAAAAGLEADLERWSTAHAALLALAGSSVALGLSPAVVAAAAALSFTLLVVACRGRWTPAGRFGPANAVTLVRAAAVLALPGVGAGLSAAALAAVVLALDGVDGAIARRTALAGPFGASADNETDALLVLMLCLLLYRLPAGPGAWILLAGMLRYAFVLVVALARLRQRGTPGNAATRAVGAISIVALIIALWAYPLWPGVVRTLLAATTLLLCLSFATSFYRMARAARRCRAFAR